MLARGFAAALISAAVGALVVALCSILAKPSPPYGYNFAFFAGLALMVVAYGVIFLIANVIVNSGATLVLRILVSPDRVGRTAIAALAICVAVATALILSSTSGIRNWFDYGALGSLLIPVVYGIWAGICWAIFVKR